MATIQAVPLPFSADEFEIPISLQDVLVTLLANVVS
jgi:hypothetical protein